MLFTELREKISPQHTALIIVDFQNDFCSEGGVYAKAGKTIDMTKVNGVYQNIVCLANRARNLAVPVIWVLSCHNKWTDSDVYASLRLKWATPRSCLENTWGSEIYKIKPHSEDIIIKKHRYDAFYGTDLDMILHNLGIKTIIFAGVATDICVESSLRSACVRDYYVVLVKDCCIASSEEAQKSSELRVDQFFGEVVNTSQIISTWNNLSKK